MREPGGTTVRMRCVVLWPRNAFKRVPQRRCRLRDVCAAVGAQSLFLAPFVASGGYCWTPQSWVYHLVPTYLLDERVALPLSRPQQHPLHLRGHLTPRPLVQGGQALSEVAEQMQA
jgi:hypothetical protein